MVPSSVELCVEGVYNGNPVGQTCCTVAVLGAADIDECSSPGSFIDSSIPTTVDTINIATSSTIDDVEIVVDITHTYEGDLDVDIASPTGTSVRLHDQGGGSADNINVTYDDNGIPNAPPYTCGCLMQPSGPGMLSDFQGQDSAGDWTLSVTDNLAGDSGTLNTWCVRIFNGGVGGGPMFKRGDVSADGGVQLNDAIFLLNYLFVPGSMVPTCMDAADVNDDGMVGLGDAIGLLNYLFIPGSAVPAAPGPDSCGVDPTDTDSLPSCVYDPGSC